MKRKQAKPSKIETVLVGNARVKIYSRTRTVGGKDYPTFEVCDYTSGSRKLRSFADHDAARKEAQRLARLLAAGDAIAAAMSGKEAASFGRCLELLRLSGDVPEIACARYADATKILGNGNLLATAAQFYMDRHPNTLPQITVAEAAAEMIELRRQNGASEPYLEDLRNRSGYFARAFAVHPATVTTADCQRYLDGLKVASITKHAVRKIIWRLFDHCERRGYIPKGSNPVGDTHQNGIKDHGSITVWTASEIASLLSHAEPDFVPFLAIGAFAGLRTSEILALDWKDVRLAEKTIKVTHRKTRCAGTRLAPIPDNLAQLLAPLAKRSGPVWRHGVKWKERQHAISAAQNATAEAAGLLPWRHNALRHSFTTYRVACTQNVAQTALECGNSATMIFKHYRALASETEAHAWFAVAPQQPANVVSLHQKAA
jgi:integrase